MAIDAVCTAFVPDYLVILGATDVVPHQDLRNPMFGSDDPDEFDFGDVPYACAAPYSQEPKDFVGPTRVVGRLPDLTGASDPAYFIDLLGAAAKWKSLAAADYAGHLALALKFGKSRPRLVCRSSLDQAPTYPYRRRKDRNGMARCFRIEFTSLTVTALPSIQSSMAKRDPVTPWHTRRHTSALSAVQDAAHIQRGLSTSLTMS